MVDLEAAYQACIRDSRAHYENFPVASLLLPRRMRPHVAALYAFARAADDFADEGERSSGDRLRLLDGWHDRLRHALAESTLTRPPEAGEPPHAQQIFLALGATARAFQLPAALLEDLLGAFAQDVTVSRYESWPALLEYCRRSANPIGRLVLRIGGYRDDEIDRLSDAICTALQLTNFWQDVARDYARGRIYVPLEELRAHGADERALAQGRLTPEWRRALASAVGRTRRLFDAGLPLCDRVRGRLGLELRLTWLGGTRILDRLEATGCDVLRNRPTIGAADLPRLAGSALAWPLVVRGRAGG